MRANKTISESMRPLCSTLLPFSLNGSPLRFNIQYISCRDKGKKKEKKQTRKCIRKEEEEEVHDWKKRERELMISSSPRKENERLEFVVEMLRVVDGSRSPSKVSMRLCAVCRISAGHVAVDSV